MIYITRLLSNTKFLTALFFITFICVIVTIQTFTDTGLLPLNKLNVRHLLILNLVFFILLFFGIAIKLYDIYLLKKNNELGSNTSKSLVLYFLSISAIPSAIISIFSVVLFNYGIQNWFNKKIENTVNNSVNLARSYLADHYKLFINNVLLTANDINRNKRILIKNNQNFTNYITAQSKLRGLQNIYIINLDGDIKYQQLSNEKYKKPLQQYLINASNGKPFWYSNAFEKKTYGIVKLNNFNNLYLYVVKNVDNQIVSFLKDTGDASTYYFKLKKNIINLQITFLIIYIMFTMLLVVSSVLVAINFASRINRPLNKIFTASKEISKGNYNINLPSDKNSDFNVLNYTFTEMSEKIKEQEQRSKLSGRFEAWEIIGKKLAHEIKNPLTPIQLSLDRIKQKIDLDTNAKEHLEIINNQIKNIKELANSFSNFSRMSKPKFEQNNISELIKVSINLYKLNYKNIPIFFNNDSKNNIIICDYSQINRVLINIIKNSIESIEEKKLNKNDFEGEINITLTEDKNNFNISIIDNGIGFKENKKNETNPYYTTKKNGSGLGLSIVSKIIHEHNGKIFFKKPNKKEGAEVTILLPKINE